MGKARFYDLFLFVLITATAFFVSGITSSEKIDEMLDRIKYGIIDFDKNYSMKFHYADYRNNGSIIFLWKNMESEENAINLSDDQFVDGKASIILPFGFPFFDRNVTHVAVTTQGTIQSDEPSVNWTIAPLKAKFGMTRSNISYLHRINETYIQWNNFRFDHAYFKEHDFSFQVRLSASGEIVFVYKKVPYHLKLLREICDCLENEFGVIYSYEDVRPRCSSSRDSIRAEWHRNGCHYAPVDYPLFCNDMAEILISVKDPYPNIWMLIVLSMIAVIFLLTYLQERFANGAFCCTPVEEHLQEHGLEMAPANQPNQPDGNNQAGNQNNDQEEQEAQENEEGPNDEENDPTQIQDSCV
ncbi:Hypothetical predicted protein [Cloeon dipterum]|uniref:Uncharacterized protein n=1 Tax=Cloeon dipterum TaxID=197152 RepID=A0A8S1DSE4_9INSE|nr:Hypothetical predicted protein [Cloeon dipterum]